MSSTRKSGRDSGRKKTQPGKDVQVAPSPPNPLAKVTHFDSAEDKGLSEALRNLPNITEGMGKSLASFQKHFELWKFQSVIAVPVVTMILFLLISPHTKSVTLAYLYSLGLTGTFYLLFGVAVGWFIFWLVVAKGRHRQYLAIAIAGFLIAGVGSALQLGLFYLLPITLGIIPGILGSLATNLFRKGTSAFRGTRK